MSSAQHSRQMLAAILAAAALLHQTLDQYVHCQFGWDKVDQLAGAARLCAGAGLALEELNADDLASPLARPLVGWPPGYSYLAAGLLIAGLDIWHTALAIDILSAALYLAGWYFLAGHSNMGRRGRLWMWVFWALAYLPLVRLTSSDQLAVALFSVALAMGAVCVRAGQAERAARGACRAVLAAVMAGLMAGLAGAVRFAYWPLAGVVPLGLFLSGSSRRWLNAGVCAAATGIILGALAWYQHATTGHTTYLTSIYERPAAALQWPMLRHMAPFPAGALGLDLFWQRAHERLHLPGTAQVGTWGLALLVLGAFFAAGYRAWRQRRGVGPLRAYIYTTGLCTLLLTLAMLCWLSLRYPPIGNWTHVQELRYYAPVFGFLTVSWFGAPHPVLDVSRGGAPLRLHLSGALRPWQWFSPRWAGSNEKDWLRRSIVLVLAALVLATMAGGGIWRVRRWWRMLTGTTPRPEHAAVFDAEGVFVQSQVASLRPQAATVYYVDERLDRRAMARLAGAVVPLPHELPQQPRTSAGVVVLTPDDRYGAAARAILARWPLASVRHVVGPGTGMWQYHVGPRATSKAASGEGGQ